MKTDNLASALRTLTYLRLPTSPLDHLTNLQTLTHVHSHSPPTACNHIILRPTSDRESNFHFETYYMYEVYKYLHNLDKFPRDYVVHPPVQNVCSGVLLESLPDLSVIYGTSTSVGIDSSTSSGLASHVTSVNTFRSSKSLPPLTYTILPSLSIPLTCGTWDRMHYGHRRLLTLAVSLVDPNGVLTIGVTSEDMIKGKERSELLRSYEEREEGVKGFVESLARGFKNNLRIVEIGEKKGTLVEDSSVECLVCSSETVSGVEEVNSERKRKGWKEVEVWVAVRGDEGGMSSTSLRNEIFREEDIKELT
ncbi:hypothetical protein TrVE_jg11578 [Triparma verrucosa]|uniref:Cytidyltransferase-like domain-containing protein n=2 Tax=Triparma TaxID=722752 RepID=A0A9W6ZUW9_9STRA|nr:hypothetical protein TrST_g8273 [Triparma strigata]GMH87450.1 hypothetical protein TrVE_jg11578 [Triparma verrucosa]